MKNAARRENEWTKRNTFIEVSLKAYFMRKLEKLCGRLLMKE
jgi:hypothetical protein